MGISYREDTTRFCFNGAKLHKLGWYSDKTELVEPLSDGVWTRRINGIVDYKSAATKTVLVRMGTTTSSDYFMLFNRKAGFNSDTKEGGDRVRIVRDNVPTPNPDDGPISVEIFSSTDTALEYMIGNFDGRGTNVRVSISEINSSVDPWYADVTIARECSSVADCGSGSGACVSNTISCTNNFCECEATKSLFTTTAANNGSQGNMVNIVAKQDISIVGFEIHIRTLPQGTSTPVEVYKRLGGYEGADENPATWISVPVEPLVSPSTQAGELSSVKLQYPIGIRRNEKMGLYITMTKGTTVGDLRYTNGASRGAVFREDPNIIIDEGLGKRYPFSSTFQPRIFNGIVDYVPGYTPDPPTPAPVEPRQENAALVPCNSDGDCISFLFTCRFSCQGGFCQPSADATACNCDYDSCDSTTEDEFTCPSDCSTDSTFLDTTMAAGNGQKGNMFTVQAVAPTQITSFDIHCNTGGVTATVQVFVKEGTYQGFEANSGAWTLIQEVEVANQGSGEFTTLPALGNPIALASGAELSFYIRRAEPDGLKYTNGSGEGNVFASDDNLRFLEGNGVAEVFGTPFRPRVCASYDSCCVC